MSYKAPLVTASGFGLMKPGSGLTVVNGVVSATSSITPNFGFFSDGTQTNPVANAVNLATFSTVGPTNGVSVVGGTAITVVNAGTYSKFFTLNISKTSGGTSSVSFWLRLNGVDVAGSRQDLELTNTLSAIFTSGNFTLDIPAGGNIQFCWSSSDTTVALTGLPAAVTPIRPTGASVKITLIKIS